MAFWNREKSDFKDSFYVLAKETSSARTDHLRPCPRTLVSNYKNVRSSIHKSTDSLVQIDRMGIEKL